MPETRRYSWDRGRGVVDTFLEGVGGGIWRKRGQDCVGLGLARIRLYESAESDGFGAWGRVKPRVRGVLGWFGWWLRSGLLALWIYPMAPLGKLGSLDPHLYGHDNPIILSLKHPYLTQTPSRIFWIFYFWGPKIN